MVDSRRQRRGTRIVMGTRTRTRSGVVVRAVQPPPGLHASSRLRRQGIRRILAKFMSVGAAAGAAALVVSTSLPANAFIRDQGQAAITSRTVAVQSLAVDTEVVAAAPVRDSYSVVKKMQQVPARISSARSNAYTNDLNGTIQWPFPVAVPIASGFGPRVVAGCNSCSTFHEGLDFIPGSGAPIQVIADGVVSLVQDDSGGLGNHVVIDHVINGQRVQSVYAHMLDGSVRVVVGQVVHVKDIVGQVGSTGISTGAHLHLEIHLDGTAVDPFAWLKANAN